MPETPETPEPTKLICQSNDHADNVPSQPSNGSPKKTRLIKPLLEDLEVVLQAQGEMGKKASLLSPVVLRLKGEIQQHLATI